MFLFNLIVDPSKKTAIHPYLAWRWASVVNVGPTPRQPGVNVWYSQGYVTNRLFSEYDGYFCVFSGEVTRIDNPSAGFYILSDVPTACPHPRDYIYMPWGYSPWISGTPPRVAASRTLLCVFSLGVLMLRWFRWDLQHTNSPRWLIRFITQLTRHIDSLLVNT